MRKIKKITIDRFKGATVPVPFEFDTSKNVVLIFGENGTGKSTIVDAIDFVCNQSFGSLEQKSVGNKKHELIVSLNNDPASLGVVLESGESAWRAGVNKSRPVRSGDGQILSVQILRRSDILKFIDGQPKERYEKLKPFISLPNCEKNEAVLRSTIKGDDASFQEAARAIEQARSALEELWLAVDSPGSNYLSWAKQQCGQDVSLSKTTVEILKRSLEAKERLEIAIKDIRKSDSELSKACIGLAKLESEKAKLQTRANADIFLKLLQDAKRYFEESELSDVCPVCQRSVNTGELKAGIESRLLELTTLSDLMTAIEKSKADIEASRMLLDRKHQDFIRDVNIIIDELHVLSIVEQNKLNIKLTIALCFEEAEKMYGSVNDCVEKFKARLLELKNIDLINALDVHLKILDEKTDNATIIEARLVTLKKVLMIVENARKAYINSVLETIAVDIESMYLSLHPAEGLGGIRFIIDPSKAGSIDINGQFQGVAGLLPQAYYSESHLDTLGVCVFLALAKYYRVEVVILDDVITSADEVHMSRYVNMLHDESINFNQTILTTHYRPLRDRYRFSQAPSGKVQLFELKPWTLSRGVQHARTTLWIDDLCHYIEPEHFDRQIVASKAGILLEALLDDLALRFRCRLPRQAEPSYNLGDLLGGLSGKLRSAMKVELIDDKGIAKSIPLFDFIARIDKNDWIRNQVGCHFNLGGISLADKDIIDFGKSVVDFANMLICPYCGTIPASEKSGTYWECRCKKNRLYPLIAPN